MNGLHTKTALALLDLRPRLEVVLAASVPAAVLVVRERNRAIRPTSRHDKLKPKTPDARPRPLPRRQHHEDVRRHRRPAARRRTPARARGHHRALAARPRPRRRPDHRRPTPQPHSGLFDYGGDCDFVTQETRDPLRAWTAHEIITIATAHPPTFAPARAGPLGLIVEAATGHPLAGELRQRPVCAPAPAGDEPARPAQAIAGRHAHGYFLRPFSDVTFGSP